MISSMSLAGILMLLEQPWRLLEMTIFAKKACRIIFLPGLSVGSSPAISLFWLRFSQSSFAMIFRLVKQIPGAVIVTGCPPWWEILFLYLIEISFFFLWYYRQKGFSVIFCLFLIAGRCFFTVPALKITMLDVGQGECIFIKMPTGEKTSSCYQEKKKITLKPF